MTLDLFTEQRLVTWALNAALDAALDNTPFHPGPFKWTLQGFGMLRTYVGDSDLRLHVWDDRYTVPGVSDIHTHPWHMRSLVVVGEVRNQRFTESEYEETRYAKQLIRCGEGGGPCGAPDPVRLTMTVDELVTAGFSYAQTADEIHRSSPTPGTITLVHREATEDADHAYVYYPYGEEWVSAEPFGASPATVADILGASKEKWGW